MTTHDRAGYAGREALAHERRLARVDGHLERLEASTPQGKGVFDRVVASQGGEEVAEVGVLGEARRLRGRHRVRVDGLRPRVGVVHGATAPTQVFHQQRAAREAGAAPMPGQSATGAVHMPAEGWGVGGLWRAGGGLNQPGDV